MPYITISFFSRQSLQYITTCKAGGFLRLTKKPIFTFKSKKNDRQYKERDKEPVTVQSRRKGRMEIYRGPDRLVFDIKYLKGDSSVVFTIKPHNRERTATLIFLIAIFFAVTASLILPISHTTNTLIKNEARTKILSITPREALRSLLINVILFL